MQNSREIEELSRAFDLPGVTFAAGRGALTKVVVASPACTGEVYLHGAHVTSWQPAGQAAVLFVSPVSRFERGKAIRGGVPICWPWFGPKRGDPDAPPHGVARTSVWTLEGIEPVDDRTLGKGHAVALTMRTVTAELRFAVTFARRLRMTLETVNGGPSPMTFEEALHTYLAVSDVRNVSVEGLTGADFLDKTAGGERRRQSDAQVSFHAETDRVYLDTTAACVVHDPGLSRRIRIVKSGSRSTVVWNPWTAKARALADLGEAAWPGMLCVETGNVADNAVTLAPGERHTVTAEIEVSAG